MWAVVVFPLLPVIAMMGASVYQLANSISLTTGIFFTIAFSINFEFCGIPGDITQRSAS